MDGYSLKTRDYDGASPVKEAGPLDRLLSAISSLEGATSQVIATTDALCGSQPQGGTDAKSEPSPAGMFAAINLSAIRVERMASVIADCMHRIDRVAG